VFETRKFVKTVISRLISCSFLVVVMSLPVMSQGVAQDTSEQIRGETEASGTFAPAGPPAGQPVRVYAGGNCVVDLRQAYEISGTLSGSLDIDYRILVRGPCETPPVVGKYDEEWIAHGTFSGTIDSSAASGSLTYTARVQAGGDVEGRIQLGGGLDGELTVSGNFEDGMLSYDGRVYHASH
jgi:hypothetical protein